MAEMIPLIAAGVSAGATIFATSKKPKPPTPEPVKPMPDRENPVAIEQERQRELGRRSTGRAGTILSDDTYGNTFLGQ